MSLGPLKISKNKHVLIDISEKIYEFFAKKVKNHCGKSKMTEIIYKLLGYPYSSMHEAIIFLTILTLRSSCFKGLRNEVFRPSKRQYNSEIDCFEVVSCYTIQFIEDIANQWTNNEGKNFKDANLIVKNQRISYFSNENNLYIYNLVYVNEFVELFADICNVVLKYRDK
ncbi:hypothetical protein TUBRATIS_25240 [Tubulinosema ratisbonensis]|uniref:Uncharacterized protein n=1 Tax=Tubulinosema ratisbonensis TaxID=291195 RepID=A0A437AIZ8_9MICR|nr:hypothetical protein TUBRATIS_25240 [Tubulinosema ratisbonensis]